MTVENGAGTAYGFRGLGKWIQNGAQVTNPVPEEYRTPAASIKDQGGTAITEAEFNDLITSIYRKTGTTDSLTLVADTALRRTISDFARIGAGANDVREFNLNGERVLSNYLLSYINQITVSFQSSMVTQTVCQQLIQLTKLVTC